MYYTYANSRHITIAANLHYFGWKNSTHLLLMIHLIEFMCVNSFYIKRHTTDSNQVIYVDWSLRSQDLLVCRLCTDDIDRTTIEQSNCYRWGGGGYEKKTTPNVETPFDSNLALLSRCVKCSALRNLSTFGGSLFKWFVYDPNNRKHTHNTHITHTHIHITNI